MNDRSINKGEISGSDRKVIEGVIGGVIMIGNNG